MARRSRTLTLTPALHRRTLRVRNDERWDTVPSNDFRIAPWRIPLGALAADLVALGAYSSMEDARNAIEQRLLPAQAEIELEIGQCLLKHLRPRAGRPGAPRRLAPRQRYADRYVFHY